MNCLTVAVVLSLLSGESQVMPRTGTHVERIAKGAVVVWNDGTFACPGVSISPVGVKTWDLSSAGAVEVSVSNGCNRAEKIYATVRGEGVGVEKSPVRSALVPPHGVRTISVQIADAPWQTDKPVQLPGMKGVVGSAETSPKFDRTGSIDVYQMLGDSRRKTVFAVLDVKTAFAARQPKTIQASTFFPFVDRYGQFKHGEWPGKIHSDAELAAARAQEEAWLMKSAKGPIADVDRFGGWLGGPQLKATGFFRVEKVKDKWWLVDPEGHLFFSLGMNCIYPGNSTVVDGGRKNWFEWLPKYGEPNCDGQCFGKTGNHLTFNFVMANLVRKYGKKWQPEFCETAHRRFRAWGINTIGNWSGARMSRLGRFPYVGTIQPLSPTRLKTKSHPKGVYVPDVWSEQFEKDVDERLSKLAKTVKDDPWCVGVYVDNELAWDLADKPCEVAEKYFSAVSEAMKRHLPNHLYLGCRFWRGGEDVWRAAARHCDVVSFNFYGRHPTKDLPPGSVDKPIIVGEFHFGAKDRGQFIGGCAETFDQEERARCFTRYVNDCLDNPRYVGCHWFQYQDQPLTGRSDGENYNDGFVSACDVPYPELVEACRRTAAQMYERKFGSDRTSICGKSDCIEGTQR